MVEVQISAEAHEFLRELSKSRGVSIMQLVNEAIERSQALAAERLSGLTGGLGLPGLV